MSVIPHGPVIPSDLLPFPPLQDLHATEARGQLQPCTQLPAPSCSGRAGLLFTSLNNSFSLENSATLYSKPRLSVKSVTTMTFLGSCLWYYGEMT